MSLGPLFCAARGHQDVDMSGDILPSSTGTEIHSLRNRAKSRMGSHFMNVVSTREQWRWSGRVLPRLLDGESGSGPTHLASWTCPSLSNQGEGWSTGSPSPPPR